MAIASSTASCTVTSGSRCRIEIASFAEAVDLVVFIAGRGLQRRIASIARLAGVDPDSGDFALIDILPTDLPQGETL